MSDLENKELEIEMKMPYSIKLGREKEVAYTNYIKAEVADELYKKILKLLVVDKRYMEPDFTAKQLTKELQTNSRYVSAVFKSRFNCNFCTLVNKLRVKEVLPMLISEEYAGVRVMDLGKMAGFTNRQTFYSSFYRWVGTSPEAFRRKRLREKK